MKDKIKREKKWQGRGKSEEREMSIYRGQRKTSKSLQ